MMRAAVLTNSGICLMRLNRLDEALANCEQALQIRYRRLEEGCAEVAADLLSNLVNKGNILINFGRSADAVECFAEAILLGNQFISDGRIEVAQNYGKALCRIGQFYRDAGEINSALRFQTSAIDLLKVQAQHRMVEFVPDLLAALHERFELLVQLDRLEQAAEDMRFAFTVANGVMEAKLGNETLVEGIGAFRDPLRKLPKEKQLLICSRLGDFADAVRKGLED
jgi:tetratricopeptide (TPR) repeat protein